MDFKYLQYFIAVYENGSIAKAAESLFISRQALSSALQKMEEEVGCPLFIRDKIGTISTDSGVKFYNTATAILKMWNDLNKDLSETTHEEQKELRVGFGCLVLSDLGLINILRFENHFPKTKLTICSMTNEDCWSKLLDGSLDMACTLSPLEPTLHKTLLKNNRAVALVGYENELSKKQQLKLSDLKGKKILHIVADNTLNEKLRALYEIHDISADFMLVDLDKELITEAIINNIGIFLLPQTCASQYMTEGITVVPCSSEFPNMSLYIVERDFPGSSAQTIFRNYLLHLANNNDN